MGTFLSNEVVPVSARVRLNLDGGKVYLELLDADMMGLPVSTLTGSTWQEWQKLEKKTS